jgi:hypothetical protein
MIKLKLKFFLFWFWGSIWFHDGFPKLLCFDAFSICGLLFLLFKVKIIVLFRHLIFLLYLNFYVFVLSLVINLLVAIVFDKQLNTVLLDIWFASQLRNKVKLFFVHRLSEICLKCMIDIGTL